MRKSATDSWIGETLPGGYVIQALIGEGGMGDVYRAEQSTLGRTVAVKIVHPHLIDDEAISARFLREARASSLLNHPHSISVIDFGRTPQGQPYLVMEYLRGKDLRKVFDQEGPLPFKRVIRIFTQLLDALSEAHGLGIIHRDIKPENIIVEPTRSGGDFVKVVDFGLAKVTAMGVDPGITAAGTVCGTPEYMSPEQCEGKELDPRSDLYAVGVNLFEMLTGRLPFEASTPTEYLIMHLMDPPPDPRDIAPAANIPDPLARVTLRSLAKKPASRFPSALDFSEALNSVLREVEAAAAAALEASRTQECRVCKARVKVTQKFCGQCGMAMPNVMPSYRPSSSSSSFSVPVPGAADSQLEIEDRINAAAWVTNLIQQPVLPKLIRIHGDVGSGRTWVMRKVEHDLLVGGARVVMLEPDPWRRRVDGFVVRRALEQLVTGLVRSAIPASVQQARSQLDPRGTRPLPGLRALACDALGWAIHRAAGERQVVLLVDDLDQVDGFSLKVLSDVLGSSAPGRLVGAHRSDWSQWQSIESAGRLLAPLEREEGELVLGSAGLRAKLPGKCEEVEPLYLEHLWRFMAEGGTNASSGLANLVASRLARLAARQRRLLQALAVLGGQVSTEALSTAASIKDAFPEVQTELMDRGWIESVPVGLRIRHPLVREIVLADTPSEVSRRLHNMACQLDLEGQPLEVQAWHAMGSEDAFDALLKLDKCGERALGMDFADGAIEAYQCGLLFARRQIERGDLDDPGEAIALFTRKLASVLVKVGRAVEAEGLLNEAMGFVDEGSREQAHLMFALSRSATARGKAEDAKAWLDRAMAVATRAGEEELVRQFRGGETE